RARIRATRWLYPSYAIFTRRSHHLPLAQHRDLAAGKTEFLQHLFGLLAEFRRARRHRAWRARQGHGLADQLNVPVLVIGHVLRDAEMLDLRILEHLVDGIDRTTGHAGVVQFLDPGLRRFFLGELVDHRVQRVAVLRARRRAGVIGIAEELRRADRLGATLPDAAACRGDV